MVFHGNGSSGSAEDEVILDRYRLGPLLGQGGFGKVFQGVDTIREEPVAVKFIEGLRSREQPSDWWVEAAILRRLDLPGVVHLRDEGLVDGQYVIVTDLIDGEHFPGSAKGEDPWENLRPRVRSLLKILSLVHQSGVVHRDLKPTNVLVDAQGHIIILDFGLSILTHRANREEGSSPAAGTLRYLAPEQIQGIGEDHRADLYAAGVMIYEGLARRPPYDGDDIAALLRAILNGEPTPLRELVPEVPEEIARWVHRLMARDPAARPSSAAETLMLLDFEEVDRQRYWLPRLGKTDFVASLLDHLDQGRSVDLVGAIGTGRTRILDEVQASLLLAHSRVFRAGTGDAPFESLPAELQEGWSSHWSLSTMKERVTTALRSHLRKGTFLFVDDWEDLDPWTQRSISSLLPEGGVVRVLRRPAPESSGNVALVETGDLDVEDLKALFDGPEVLFQIPERGAAALWHRTGGRPSRVVAELQGWIDAGLAYWQGEGLHLEPLALERLQTGLTLGASLPAVKIPAELYLRDLLATVLITGTTKERSILCQLLGWPTWKVEAGMEALEAQGVLSWLGGGSFVEREVLLAEQLWSAERVEAGHSLMAAQYPQASRPRIFHAFRAQKIASIATEVVHRARTLDWDGQTGLAIGLLLEALSQVQRQGGREEVLFFEEWAKITLATGDTSQIEGLLFEMQALRGEYPELKAIRALAEVARMICRRVGTESLTLVTALPPFEDEEWELRRQKFRVQASWGVSLSEGLRLLEEIEAWAEHSRLPDAMAYVHGWKGLLRYREGDFLGAARLHEAAATGKLRKTSQIASLLNSGSAYLAASRFKEAHKAAQEAINLAESVNHARYLARALYIHRAARYQAGELIDPDEDLSAAVSTLGMPEVEGLVSLMEGVFAWRQGQRKLGIQLAVLARNAWSASGNFDAMTLADALLAACDLQMSPEEKQKIFRRVVSLKIPNLKAQCLGLLLWNERESQSEWTAALQRVLPSIPQREWKNRREILSIAEVVERCL